MECHYSAKFLIEDSVHIKNVYLWFAMSFLLKFLRARHEDFLLPVGVPQLHLGQPGQEDQLLLSLGSCSLMPIHCLPRLPILPQGNAPLGLVQVLPGHHLDALDDGADRVAEGAAGTGVVQDLERQKGA